MALEAGIKSAMAAKLEEMAPLRDEAQAWIEACTGDAMEGTFDEWLRSGAVLCKLLNAVSPGAVKKVYEGKMPFKQMEQIGFFLKGIKKYGVVDSDCFDTNDLFKGQDIGKVIACVHSLGAVVQKKGEFEGPQLGVKLATANKREFTEEQLNEAKAATSKLTVGSSAKMERTEVLKTGVTMGNTYAGGSGSSEASKLTQGSQGKMERSAVIKTGITMGNEYAGGGGAADGISKLHLGSGDTMERSEVRDKGITMGADASK